MVCAAGKGRGEIMVLQDVLQRTTIGGFPVVESTSALVC